jgi:hypothetical protein
MNSKDLADYFKRCGRVTQSESRPVHSGLFYISICGVRPSKRGGANSDFVLHVNERQYHESTIKEKRSGPKRATFRLNQLPLIPNSFSKIRSRSGL